GDSSRGPAHPGAGIPPDDASATGGRPDGSDRSGPTDAGGNAGELPPGRAAVRGVPNRLGRADALRRRLHRRAASIGADPHLFRERRTPEERSRGQSRIAPSYRPATTRAGDLESGGRGRVAQWESARFTRERSLVRNQ